MKQTNLLTAFLFCIIVTSCIQDDIINDRVDPILRIENPLETLAIGATYQLEATYLNNIGQEEVINLSWITSDDQIVQVDNSGNILANNAGTATITVSAIDSENNLITTQDDITVTDNTNEEITIRSGIISTTSSYALSGNFTMEEITEENNIIIQISEDYEASTALPGLYLYLTNNPNSINGAYEVGPVTVFSGAHTYTFSANDVGLNQYGYLLYWCKPFSVKVGQGLIE